MNPQIIPLKNWLSTDEFPVIAGPCSAENYDQVMETARLIASISGVKIFRAGVWKPRTRPGDFEGCGIEGLKWLSRVKSETGLLTAIEVASPVHIENALKSGIDIIWLGARTVVNPFSVQEISDCLRGVDIPVLVKNPLTPDLKLWLGAIERLVHTGITKIIAIHRGFYSYEKSIYRNSPLWDIPLGLKSHMPELPVFNDPSHISGKRALIEEIINAAIEKGTEGLMIEVHHNPDIALTDAEQQITPARLGELLAQIKHKNSEIPVHAQKRINELRLKIDLLDDELISILSDRKSVSLEIGKIKNEEGLQIFQPDRWQKTLESRIENARIKGLDEEFIRQILEIIHLESIKIQENIK